MIKSVESLKARVKAIHQYLLDVQSGKIDSSKEQDQQTLRDIKGLCHRLPVMTQEKFRADLLAVRTRTHRNKYRATIAESALIRCQRFRKRES